MKHWLTIGLVVGCILQCVAAETILVGDVMDAATGEPIANANIYFAGTKIGTATNHEGAFAIRTDLNRKRTLVVSAVGYHTERYAIEPGTMAGIQVALREKTAWMEEVVVLPGENPALPLLREVRNHRPENDRTLRQEATTAESRKELYISEIQRRHLQRNIWRSLEAGMLTAEDSTLLLPLYRSREQVQLQGTTQASLGDKKEESIVLTEQDYSALLGEQGNINFYQSTIPLLGRGFLSPLSGAGNAYYRFYLRDSFGIEEKMTVEGENFFGENIEGKNIKGENIKGGNIEGEKIGGKNFGEVEQTIDTLSLHKEKQTEYGKIYVVDFRTKNPFYATFNGTLYIDSATYGLRKVEATVPAQSSVNYLSNLRIRQELAPDGTLLSEDISTLLDFALKTDTTHLFPTVLLRQHLRAKQRDIANAQRSEMDSVGLFMPHGSERINDTGRAETDSVSEAFDALAATPVVRTAKWFATIITTGYIPTGTRLDIGHIEEILQVNKHEGVHVGLPLRTNEKLWKNVSLEAAVGYGFRDQAWKGMGRVSVNLPTLRRNILHIEYKDQYVWSEVDDMARMLRENSMGWKNMDFTAYAFEALHANRNTANTAARLRQIEVRTENDWSEHTETTLYARMGWQGYGDPMAGYHKMPNYAVQTLGGIVRIGFGERKIDGYFRRIHRYSRYPVLYIGAEAGSWKQDGMESYRMYARLNLLVRQRISLGMGGELDWALQAGYIAGRIPYTLLHHFEGNQGYGYDPYRFTLMNDFQYAADKYMALHAQWNGQGILFNLIPGIRYLRLRELVSLKMAYGGLRNSNRELLGEIAPPTADGQSMSAPTTPYTEIGIGIGNILRVADLYSVWRLTNRQDTATPRWGIRFRIHIDL